jgi:hypothetical protein
MRNILHQQTPAILRMLPPKLNIFKFIILLGLLKSSPLEIGTRW